MVIKLNGFSRLCGFCAVAFRCWAVVVYFFYIENVDWSFYIVFLVEHSEKRRVLGSQIRGIRRFCVYLAIREARSLCLAV